MTKITKTLLDRLEKRAGEIEALKIELTAEKVQSEQYFKWWQEEETKVKELEDCVEAGNEAAGLNIVEKPNDLDGPDDVDVERMQSTADHDPEAMPNG
tara:strand:- start:151 stop:444 length:294 start_codon:yes stop_codon:yes gene_type:complete